MVRIDDDAVGYGFSGQVVVGNDHVQTQFLRPRHACDAGDAVVDCNQQIHALRGGDFGKLGRQAVAMFEAIGYEEIHRRAHRRQAAYADGTRGRAVGIIVGDNQNFFLALDGIRQTAGGGFAIRQRLIRQEAGEFVVQLGRTLHVARGAQPGD